MTDTIHIADRTAEMYLTYPEQFNACREHWLEYVDDPDRSKETYVAMVTRIAGDLEASDVPIDDRTDVVLAAYWAAAADASLSAHKHQAEISAREVRTALEELW